MKKGFFLGSLLIFGVSYLLCSCEKEEEHYRNNTTTTSTTTTSTTTTSTTTIKKPEVSVSSAKANSAYDGWWVIAKVTTGGDKPENVQCYLEWSKFSKKQTGTISYEHKDKMNLQSSSSSQVLFKTEHAGINSGTYIYYRLVGSNSKYTTTGAASYMVATKY